MEVLHQIPNIQVPTVVALGLFDGIHAGHQKVISEAVRQKDLTPIVFSFFFDGDVTKRHFSTILSPALRYEKLDRLGVSCLIEPPFSQIRSLSPEAFFEEILQKKLHAKAIVCGENFHFGVHASGNAALLYKLCSDHGLSFTSVPFFTVDGLPVSSSRIRNAIEQGDIPLANRLLKYPYQIDFTVSHGKQLGRVLGFPTINQIYPEGFTLPRFGVYATKAVVDGKKYNAVTNVGTKPTIAGHFAPSAESYLLDFSGDLYDQKVTLEFYAFVRDERRFENLDALKAQISEDSKKVRSLLDSGLLL